MGGVQIQMLRKLSEIYGVPFSDNMGKSVLASLAGSLIPASTATTTAMGVGSLMKGMPGVGTMVGALTMPAFSAGATYIIGKVFIQHFASGGTLARLQSSGLSGIHQGAEREVEPLQVLASGQLIAINQVVGVNSRLV